MTWLDEPSGTVTQWAVELEYGDGERRHYCDDFIDEKEASDYAEVKRLERLREERPPTEETDVVAYRAVSRQVTYGEWTRGS